MRLVNHFTTCCFLIIASCRYSLGEVTMANNDVIVCEGDRAEIICTTSSDRPVEFSQYREGPNARSKRVYSVDGILNGFRSRFTVVYDSSSRTYTLVINNTTLSDAAEYSCDEDYGNGPGHSAIILRVQAKGGVECASLSSTTRSTTTTTTTIKSTTPAMTTSTARPITTTSFCQAVLVLLEAESKIEREHFAVIVVLIVILIVLFALCLVLLVVSRDKRTILRSCKLSLKKQPEYTAPPRV